MTRRRGAETAAGVGALVTLLALVIGLPVVLYALGGSPLPGHLPELSRIGHDLLHRTSASVVLTAVRDVSWIAWALFTIGVLAELQALLRRRTPPRLWLGGLQGAAGRLVALAALTFSSAPVGTLLTTPQPASAMAVVVPHGDVTAAPQAGPAPQSDAAPQGGIELMADQAPLAHQDAHGASQEHASASARTGSQGMSMGFFQLVTVRPGDCLWSIAQHYLGNGDRYTEIVALNMGHDMGHGHVFTDASMIWPGWVLHLPSGDHGSGGHGSGTHGTHGTGRHGTGGHGPHTEGTGHHRPGGATHSGHPTHHRRFSSPHPSASASGNGHAPSGTRSTPPTSTTTSPLPVSHGGQGGGASPGGSASQAGGHATGLESAPESRLPLILAFGSGALAGGAAVSLSRLRHRQRQNRRRGRRIPLPVSAPVVEAEQRLNLTAEQQPVASLRGVLRDLGAGLVASGQQIPEIEALRLTPDLLDILLASPAIEPPPPPFTVPGGRQGKAWRLTLSDPLSGYPDEVGDLLPGLLTIGASEGGYLLLDLEHLQVTQVCGARSMTESVLRTAAAELATGQLAGWYDLIMVGFPELDVLGGRGTCCDTLDAGLDLLAAKAVALRRRLGEDPLADVRYHRLTEPGDEDWALTLLVSAVPPTSGQLAMLSDLAADPGGIAALVPGGAGTPPGHREPVTIDLEAAQGGDGIVARIWPLQLEARPQPLDDADYEALTTLFATATEEYDVSPADPPYDDWTWPADLADRVGDDPAAGAEADTDPGPAVAHDAIPEAAPLDTEAEPADSGQAGADEPGGPGPWAAAPGWSAGGDWATDPGWSTDTDRPTVNGNGEATGAELSGPPAAWLAEPPAANGHPVAAEEPAVTHDFSETAHQASGNEQAAESADSGQPPEETAAQPALRIGVLGAFTINGQPGALLPAQSQLVLALALNGPSGLSNQQLCYLLGADPDRPKPSDSLRQLIVRTRRQLGRAPDRREWIEHLGGGQYALHPDARFDWREFDAMTTDGMRARDAQRLRQALGLIRGRPFTGCYYWWLDLATTEAVRAQIVDAADVLAALELAAGNAAAAARAARIGLSGDPAAEQLWRALMRAEHAAGNLTGVREAWNRCLDAISEIAPDGEPHPGTAALYRELLGGQASARPAWTGGGVAG